jgi:replicative DNA helicase
MDISVTRENERALLGAIMRDPSRFEPLADIVTSDSFDWSCYGWAWKAMVSLNERNMGIDVITVGDELERKGSLQEFSLDVGGFTGRAALSKLREEGEPRHVDSYAANVLDHSAKKEIVDLMSSGPNWAVNGRSANDIITDLSQRMGNIRTFDSRAATHTATIGEAVSDAYDYSDRASQGKIIYVPTGYIDMDNVLSGGMTSPDLYIVAARPGQGKTAFLVSVARNAAEKKKRTAIFSLEMMNRQVAMRLIAQESGVSYDRQKSGKMSVEDWQKYTDAVEIVSGYPIIFNDMPAISISRIRQELRRMGKVDAVMVDYIQLGGVDGKYDRRDQEIGEITGGLKSIAKEFDVPVLAAAQLSRALEQRSNKRPVLSDLRESGSLENDADVVMFIYRPDQYENDAMQNKAEIIVSKHRNGPVGTVDLIFRPELTRFESATSRVFAPNGA